MANTNKPDAPTLLTNVETAARLGILPKTLEIWRCQGKGPRFIKLGPQPTDAVRYNLEDVNEWITAHTFNNNRQSMAELKNKKG
jgi:predicted DNA-binding transcriptional regulator AlpA